MEPELNTYVNNIVSTDASDARAIYHLCGLNTTWDSNLLW